MSLGSDKIKYYTRKKYNISLYISKFDILCEICVKSEILANHFIAIGFQCTAFVDFPPRISSLILVN